MRVGRFSSIYSQGGVVEIQDHVSIRQGSIIFGFANVRIGSGTRIGPNVVITSHQHAFDGNTSVGSLASSGSPINIGNNCWIGANAVILPGTKLEAGCVVGAGTVVKGNFSKGVITNTRTLNCREI